ncbi:MAG: PEP-CTERM sorting domain-containing protein [Verrucomicrobia bacterium]|nr:PEP-CTERM sorting domain-containing protein [Verrucomicrobiota bacterium]MCH8514521.1 PEP-CTERM sorting domain-containing protein [Kiritimatiellia bacterium]
MKTKLYFLSTLFSAALVAASSASASLLFEETFPMGSGPGQYETGNVIGQPGSGGDWSGSARLGGGGIQVPGGTGNHGFFPGEDPGNFGIQSGGHSYPGLATGGARLAGGTFFLSNGNAASTQNVARNAVGFPSAAQGTGEYYFSLTAQAPTIGSLGADEYIGAGFTRAGTTVQSAVGFSLGFRGDQVVLHGRGFGVGGGDRVFQNLLDANDDPITYSAGETYFLVLHYDSDTRNVEAWLNPDLSGNGNALATWSGSSTMTSFAESTHLNGIDLYSITTTTDTENLTYASFGDYRVGTTFESVAIPEPGTLVLLGAALGILWKFRRRK